MKQVAVIIPLYKNQHTPAERLSLLQTHTVLKNHPLIVVHPEGLDVSPIRDEYPRFEYRAFDKTYFDGLEGYNRFMLSPSSTKHLPTTNISLSASRMYISSATNWQHWSKIDKTR